MVSISPPDEEMSTHNMKPSGLPALTEEMMRSEPNFWLDTLGSGLSVLMDEVGYKQEVHDDGLSFFVRHVAPYLGPCPIKGVPGRWKSFVTDDFSPFEYSWSWESSPKIRYVFEPVGAKSGTRADVFNRMRPLECADELRSAIHGSDWRSFQLFANSFYEPGSDACFTRGTDESDSSPSSIFLAIEIDNEKTMAKSYLIPVRAEQTQQTRLSVLTEGIDQYPVKLPAYKLLEEYIRQRQAISPFHIIGIAVDCVDPLASKLKIYLRCQETSFDSVCSILSFGGRIKAWNSKVIGELWELWQLVLSLPSNHHSTDEVLDKGPHETSGIMYNFDVQPNNDLPTSKLYIPVKHYGKNDRMVAQGLVTFLRRRGRTEHTGEFLRALERLCSYRRLEDSCGIQTYISCAVKNGRLTLTSYMSPEIHHRGRWL